MGYRRTKAQADEARKWEEFVLANETLLRQTGIPASIYRVNEMWDDFLMHGCIDHHDDPTRFLIDELNAHQRAALRKAVDLYLEAFGDPGLFGYPYE